jgi:hypothetical protein
LMSHDSQGVTQRNDRRAGSQDVTESEDFAVSFLRRESARRLL